MNGWKSKKKNEFRILSLDGGGMKGVFPAKYLANIEEQVSKPIHHYFDLITGTSTGGIIALGLSNEIAAKEILDLYIDRGKEIFGTKRTLSSLSFKSYYNNIGLKKVLQDTFQDKLLEDAKTLVCIPAIEHHKASPKVYKTPHHSHFIWDGNIEMWKIALATSAAPIFFPAAEVSEEECKIDGGLWANNPVLIAISEAIFLGYSLDQIKILSIGTGTSMYEVNNDLAIKGGLLSWKKNIIDLTMQTQSKGAHYTAHYLVGDGLCRIDYDTKLNFNLDTTDTSSLSKLSHEANTQFLHTFEKGGIREKFFSE